MIDAAAKFDRLAERFSDREYANLQHYMNRRLVIARRWGTPLAPGDSVLELGCGDGSLGERFVRAGFRYLGVDASARMVESAEWRLRRSGCAGHYDFRRADVRRMTFEEPCDAAVAFMRTFFSYVPEPLTVLRRLRLHVRKKVILDLDPRRDRPLSEALRLLRLAGFRSVSWRPFLVPQRRALRPWVLSLLAGCEGIPGLRSLPLRWNFLCLLKGET